MTYGFRSQKFYINIYVYIYLRGCVPVDDLGREGEGSAHPLPDLGYRLPGGQGGLWGQLPGQLL